MQTNSPAAPFPNSCLPYRCKSRRAPEPPANGIFVSLRKASKGEAVPPGAGLQVLGNAGSGALQLSRRVNNMATIDDPILRMHWGLELPVWTVRMIFAWKLNCWLLFAMLFIQR